MNSDTDQSESTKGNTSMDCDTPKENHCKGNQGPDDDPVVHEIPVFLAKSLAKQLFLYQVNVSFSIMSIK